MTVVGVAPAGLQKAVGAAILVEGVAARGGDRAAVLAAGIAAGGAAAAATVYPTKLTTGAACVVSAPVWERRCNRRRQQGYTYGGQVWPELLAQVDGHVEAHGADLRDEVHPAYTRYVHVVEEREAVDGVVARDAWNSGPTDSVRVRERGEVPRRAVLVDARAIGGARGTWPRILGLRRGEQHLSSGCICAPVKAALGPLLRGD